ncbi:hypothetical protein NL676_025713 [Syzygium grande]|nr:hypothetical protein NL676_025713 [Syzygium grande]
MAFVVFVEWYLLRDGASNRWPFFLAIVDSVLFDLSVSKNNAIADDEGTHHLAVSIVCFVLATLCGSVELRSIGGLAVNKKKKGAGAGAGAMKPPPRRS